MKKNLFILSMFLLVVGIVSAQERYQDTEFFTKKIFVSKIASPNDTTIILYEKGNCQQPSVTLGHGVKNPKALYEYMGIILEKIFPEKPDPKELDMIEKIKLDLVYNGKGEIRFFAYRLSPAIYNDIPDLESKLYRFITEFKAKGMLDYDITPEGAPLDSCSFAGSNFGSAIKFMWQKKEEQ